MGLKHFLQLYFFSLLIVKKKVVQNVCTYINIHTIFFIPKTDAYAHKVGHEKGVLACIKLFGIIRNLNSSDQFLEPIKRSKFCATAVSTALNQKQVNTVTATTTAEPLVQNSPRADLHPVESCRCSNAVRRV